MAQSESPGRRRMASVLSALGERGALQLLPGLALFAAICLFFVDYLPVWDAREYFDCLQGALDRGAAPVWYDCAQHPTMAYLWLLSLGLRLSPDSYVPVILGNLVLGALAIVAFHDIARRLLPQPEQRTEVALATLAFAVAPPFTASAVHLGPDFGVLVFGLLSTRELVHGRPAHAALWGIGAVFSKEAGLLLHLLQSALYLVVFVTRRPTPWPEKRRALLAAWPLAVPPVLYAARGAMAVLAQAPANEWMAGKGVPLWRQFLSFSFLDNFFPAALAGALLLNFAWLAVLPVAARALRAAGRFVAGLPRAAERDRTDLFVPLLFAASLLALTRFRTAGNVRYVLPVLPLLLLLAARSLAELTGRAKLRAAALGVMAAAFLSSNLRLTDPLSAAVYGTFQFGERPMLHMTSLTGECCGRGRDQLVYNLEFTQFHYLLNDVFEEVLANERAILAVHSQANRHLLGQVDRATRRRTLAREGILAPRSMTAAHLPTMARPPAAVRYIDLPNFDHRELDTWLQTYDAAGKTRYARGGYAVDVYDLRRRQPAAAAPPQGMPEQVAR